MIFAICLLVRSAFEAEQLEQTRARLRNLKKSAKTERDGLTQLRADADELTRSIDQDKEEVQELLKKLEELQAQLDEMVQKFDDTKRKASKSVKALDKALKEIGTWVRIPLALFLVYSSADFSYSVSFIE